MIKEEFIKAKKYIRKINNYYFQPVKWEGETLTIKSDFFTSTRDIRIEITNICSTNSEPLDKYILEVNHDRSIDDETNINIDLKVLTNLFVKLGLKVKSFEMGIRITDLLNRDILDNLDNVITVSNKYFITIEYQDEV